MSDLPDMFLKHPQFFLSKLANYTYTYKGSLSTNFLLNITFSSEIWQTTKILLLENFRLYDMSAGFQHTHQTNYLCLSYNYYILNALFSLAQYFRSSHLIIDLYGYVATRLCTKDREWIESIVDDCQTEAYKLLELKTMGITNTTALIEYSSELSNLTNTPFPILPQDTITTSNILDIITR